MLRLQDEDQMGDDIQPSGDDAQQAPQADEGISDDEDESADTGAIGEETKEGDIEGGAEEMNV